MTVYVISSCPCSDGTVDLTPRHAKAFRARAGEKFQWTNTALAGNRPLAAGIVTADAAGLVTVPRAAVSKGKNRIAIVKQRGDTLAIRRRRPGNSKGGFDTKTDDGKMKGERVAHVSSRRKYRPMSTARVLEQHRHLSNAERLEVAEAATRLVRDTLSSGTPDPKAEGDHRLRIAAASVRDLYEAGSDLTALDAEEFADDDLQR
jgi:hypothetical protein